MLLILPLPSWVEARSPEAAGSGAVLAATLLPPPEDFAPSVGHSFDDLVYALQHAHDRETSALQEKLVVAESQGGSEEASDELGAYPTEVDALLFDDEGFNDKMRQKRGRMPSNFKSTVDSWNRKRDFERIDERIGSTEWGNSNTIFVDPAQPGTVIAWGYNRLLFGDHGPYVECSHSQVMWISFPRVKRKSRMAYYDEHFTVTDSEVCARYARPPCKTSIALTKVCPRRDN